MTKIADTFNEYGTPVTMFACVGCGSTFTVCPAVPEDKQEQWTGCMAERCSTYDEARDADKLLDQGKVQRVGDRSCFTVIDGAALSPKNTESEHD